MTLRYVHEIRLDRAVPRAASTLLAAADRYPASRGEDRATEVLAAVLGSDDRLGCLLFRLAGRELSTSSRFRVSTQVWLGGGSRPDLHLVADEPGVGQRELHIECKWWAIVQETQKGDYARLLPAGSTLVALAPAARRAELEALGHYTVISWEHLASEVAGLGRRANSEAGRPPACWRRDAVLPDAAARSRLYLELLTYLERWYDVMTIDRVTPTDIHAYAEVTRAEAAVLALFEAAMSSSTHGLLPGPVTERGRGSWWTEIDWEAAGSPAWADPGSEHDGGWANLEVLVAPTDEWRDDGYGAPAFAAGLTVGGSGRRWSWPAALDASAPVRDALSRGDFDFCTTDAGARGRCVRTLYLHDVVARATTLDEQAGIVRTWASETIRDLVAIGTAARGSGPEGASP